MSLNFPITLSGKSGSPFSFLLDGMEEWWEDADDVSKHSGTTVLTNISANSSVGNSPTGLSSWARTTASENYGGVTNRNNDYTFAFLVNKYSAGDYKELIQLGASSAQLQYRAGNLMWCDNINYEGAGNKFSTTAIVRGAWQTIILTNVNNRMYLYVDGVSAKPGGHLYNATGDAWWKFAPDTTFSVATIAKWGRGFTQTDVDAFHNGGAFLTYSML